ncbi:BsuPI-related putative proteinase inhibitor [Geomicrobium sp. JCM 19055]|uniref:BsuPI-related putative proteinase inhibitor n=1 Tax=Geomicrobium sp. JCM 19055 TaxID=1460649 RepID=UPI00045ED67C|nr:BsuPI-related putative proteinase inhibitor [Geomicrobium sp. JCM 19055]GAK00993.1 hypothetical protein JCM19055_4126 [Geomicrobium sp. JCM 19055]
MLALKVNAVNEKKGVTVWVSVQNESEEVAELLFNTSQRISIAVYDDNQKRVYRSESEWMYLQVVEHVMLQANEEVVFQEKMPSSYFEEGHTYKGSVRLAVHTINDEKTLQQPQTFTFTRQELS